MTKSKNKYSCLLAGLFSVVLLCNMLCGIGFLPATAANEQGMTFNAKDIHKVEKFAEFPDTVEAWIYFPPNTASTLRGGVILGNYQANESCINYEIAVGGYPKVWYETHAKDAANGAYLCEAVEFKDVCVYTGEWLHLAIVRDVENKQLRCYVNGDLKQTATATTNTAQALTLPEVPYKHDLVLGGDMRGGNAQYFKGNIKSVAVYEDARTAAEIAADMTTVGTDGLLANWNLTTLTTAGYVPDLSGNGYHAMTDAYVASIKGKTFNATDIHQLQTSLTAYPSTYEAWVKFPANAGTLRGGAILGNYMGGNNAAISFEINSGGAPRVYYETQGYSDHASLQFNDVSVYTGDWVHVAIVRDVANNQMICYINGEVAQILADTLMPEVSYTNKLVLGGDLRSGNAQYFKGELKSVAVYADARTADEIKRDMNAANGDDLIASWNLLNLDTEGYIPDVSGNGYHAMTTSYAAASKGMAFAVGSYYQAEKVLPSLSGGFEAKIYFPTTTSGRGGIILGNYGSAGDCVSFEINGYGCPRIYCNDNGTVGDYNFNEVNVYNGKVTNIKILVNTATNALDCYVDGEVKQSIALAAVPSLEMTAALVLGGDLRSGNEQYFKGTILSAKVYDSIGGAVASYDLSEKSGAMTVADETGNGYTMKLHRTWITDKEAVTDYAFSMVAIGDTQIVAKNYPDKLHYIYDWVLNNKESKNIQYVMGLGDITDADTNAEWDATHAQISRMDGVVPYSVVRGNHDSIAQYNKYMNVAPYNATCSGSYGEGVLNTWRTLTVGDIHYLIMGLDYGAADDVLAWAGDVIEAHPYHNVIITTHAYLYRDGTTLDSEDVCPPAVSGGYNNGDHMWDKLIKKHENIVLVLSGHDPCDNVIMTQTAGENGNIVTQMLVDPQGVDAAQGATGMVAVLYFSEDGKNVTVEQYSTVKEQYYMDESQFEMELNVIQWPGDVTVDENGLVTVAPGKGYELKAGSLIVTDAEGNKFVPERVGYRNGGNAAQYKIPEEAVGECTVAYEFIRPGEEDGYNIGFLGTSVYEEEDKGDLRFVYRLNIDKDGKVLYNGEKVAVKEYGLLLASAAILADAKDLDIETAADSMHVHQFAWPTSGRYYDKCDEYADIAVQVNNIPTAAANMNLHSRVYLILEDNTVVYMDAVTANYANAK